MSDEYALPQAPADAEPGPVTEAQHAWIDGYEPGNPWQSKLCLRTPQGTVSYPLTPHTMPDLLEGLVLVAQAQQGVTGIPEGDGQDEDGRHDDPNADPGPGLQGGRAARMTGWALVHDLWEEGDSKVRFIMGAVVVALLVLGIVLS
ncbi:hypothetical protein ACIPY6_38640 [Streptomyces sp. NPDC090054]|uniref:hypothetical protein n=1 Tax=Streptomyces sp. NPDC090054 TaxID=3365933 RepID=UPI00382015A0